MEKVVVLWHRCSESFESVRVWASICAAWKLLKAQTFNCSNVHTVYRLNQAIVF